MKIVNPATEEQIADLPEDNKTTLERKMSLLRAAQPAWQKVSVSDRTRVLSRFCELLKENIEELAGILTSEVGKPLQMKS
jgi:acyl-CoA reductase-like NAD-dependent aldehyde dehydrogenase